MDESKRAARRKLLGEIKGPWDSEKLDAAMNTAPQPPTPEVQAAVDAAVARVVDEHDPPPISVPTMDQLDSAWGEEDAEEEDDEDVPDEEPSEPELPEPELPDERLDPAAYLAAKSARDERLEARRERRRLKVEAKKARRRARADAAKGKQKGKTKKARPQAPTHAPAAKVDDTEADDVIEATAAPSPRITKARPRGSVVEARPRTGTNTWMVAVAVIVILAAAVAAAVVFR